MSDTAVFAWRPRFWQRSPGDRQQASARSRGPSPAPLPPIRIPVTPDNRTRLRRLRAAELERWTKTGSDSSAEKQAEADNRAAMDREGQVLLLLVLTALVAVLVQITPWSAVLQYLK